MLLASFWLSSIVDCVRKHADKITIACLVWAYARSFPPTLMMQVTLTPLSLVSIQAPLIFHSTCSVRFFQKAVVVIVIAELARTCNIMRRGHMHMTNWLFMQMSPPHYCLAKRRVYIWELMVTAMTSLIRLERAQNDALHNLDTHQSWLEAALGVLKVEECALMW